MKINVVKDYDWTSAPRGSAFRQKAPRVWIKSFKVDSNLVKNRFKNYAELIKSNDVEKYYDELYGNAAKPEDDFNFPFFQDSITAFTNSFGDTFQNGFGGSGGIGENLAGNVENIIGVGKQVMNAASIFKDSGDLGGAFMDGFKNTGGNFFQQVAGGTSAAIGAMGKGTPGSFDETPKFYEYTAANNGPLEVSFVLANTINDDYDKNYELVKKLTEINKPRRISSSAMEPPRIYQIRVPGHRFIRWAYCSSFNVTFLGTKRLINDIIVPEGYQITMSFQSLTVEVSNFMEQM